MANRAHGRQRGRKPPRVKGGMPPHIAARREELEQLRALRRLPEARRENIDRLLSGHPPIDQPNEQLELR